jgi:hypothetical protein
MRVSGEEAADGDRAIDLRGAPISLDTVRAAIQRNHPTVRTEYPEPTRWWPTLGIPRDDAAPLDRLVAAARSRGQYPPAERALAAAQRELREITVERVDTDGTRRRLADAGSEVERLREEVATARGRLQSRQEMGADTAEAEAALDDAVRRLSEAETERVAAEQAHDAAQRRARETRAARERRLRLQDRVANRRRDTRHALAASVEDAFAAAVDALPGEATFSIDPLGVEGDEVTAALAAARIADLRAPVIDTTRRFESASAGAEALDAPVVRL